MVNCVFFYTAITVCIMVLHDAAEVLKLRKKIPVPSLYDCIRMLPPNLAEYTNLSQIHKIVCDPY